MADYRERLAQRVRHERERAQMSRDELALRAGLNPKTIERIEERKIDHPRGNTIRSLAEALSLEASDLNPPPELEEERLERLEEKIDGIEEMVRRIRLHQLEGLLEDAAEAEREAAALRSQQPPQRLGGSAPAG